MTTPFFTGWIAEGVGSGTVFIENTAATYTRQSVTLGALASGQTSLLAGVTFPANGSATVVTQRGLYDAPINGNLLLFWNLSGPVHLGRSQTDTIPAGDLVFSFPALTASTPSAVLWVAGTAVGACTEGAPVLTGAAVAVSFGVMAAVSGSSTGTGGGGVVGATGTGLPTPSISNTIATPSSTALSVLIDGTTVEYVSLPHLATALGVGSVSGGATLPTPSSGNIVTSPGAAVVALVTTAGIVEYITTANFGSALGVGSTGSGGALPTPSASNTVATPGSLVLPLVTNTGTVEFITPANLASSLGLGGPAGLPAPGSANTVTSIGGGATIPFIPAGGSTVEYITPANLVQSVGTFPTVATTGTIHASDLLLLYQGGTIAQVGSIGALFSALQTYQAANLPQINLTTPGTISAGSVFNVTGTLYNYIATPALSVEIDGGAFGALGAGSSVSLTATPNINLVVGSLAVGPHTLQIKDTANGVFSNAISFTASLLPNVVLNAPVGVQPAASYQATATLQNYGTGAPTLQYSVDSGPYAAIPAGSAVSTSSATIANLPGLSAGTHTIAIEDTINAVFSNVATFVVATETLTLNNPGSQYAATAFNLTGSYAHGAPSAFDWSINNGGSWTAGASPTVTGAGSGTFAFPITIGSATAAETIAVRDHNLPSIVTSPQVFVVNPAPTPATITNASSVATSGSLVTLQFSEPVTLSSPGAITLFANGVVDSVTWTNSGTAATSLTGTVAMPITTGETVTYNTTNVGFTFPNLATLTTGGTIINNSTLTQTISVVAPSAWYQNAPQVLTGGYVGPTPSGINAKFDSATSYTAISSPTIGGGAWAGTITSPAAGNHIVSVQEAAPYTGIVATSGTFSVSSGFALSFSGAAGAPTGNQVVTPFSGASTNFQLDGNGNLQLLSTSYQYGALAALGIQADGTLTLSIASGYQGPVALLFRINATLSQYYALIYTGTFVELFYAGSGGAGFVSNTYPTPATLSTLAVQYSGTTMTAYANGAVLGSWTDSNVTAAGYVGIGAVTGSGTTRVSKVTHS